MNTPVPKTLPEISTSFETRRGNKCVVIQNYKFREYRRTTDGMLHYHCTKKSCNASVYVNPATETVIDSTGKHNHDAYSERTLLRENVRSSVKRKAEDEPMLKPEKIITKEIRKTDGA